MARMPGAEWLGEQSPRTPMDRYDVVCIHTIVGFAPAHAAHFSVKLDGMILQSRDTKYRSGANLDGNHRVIAIENEDAAKDIPLTPEQVESNAQILAWANRVHDIPLQLCPDSRASSRGIAVHRQGIDGNFTLPSRTLGLPRSMWLGRVSGGEHWSTSTGKVCPRDNKIAQVPAVLARAKQIIEGDDMAEYADDLKRIEEKVDAIDDVVRAKLTRANESLREANRRLKELGQEPEPEDG